MRYRIFTMPEHLERLVCTPFCHPFTLSAQLPASCTLHHFLAVANHDFLINIWKFLVRILLELSAAIETNLCFLRDVFLLWLL